MINKQMPREKFLIAHGKVNILIVRAALERVLQHLCIRFMHHSELIANWDPLAFLNFMILARKKNHLGGIL